MVSGLTFGTLSPHSDEFGLICALVKKVMVKGGNTADRRTS